MSYPRGARGAARFSEKITFQRQTDETDAYGNTKGAFAAIPNGEVWADIRETTGKEKIASGAVESTRSATIRVRYSSVTAAITAADRVQALGAVWNIRSGPVRVERAPRVLEFLCETGGAT